MLRSVAVGLLIACIPGEMVLADEDIIIAQKDAPIEIVEYSAEYDEGGEYSSEGIRHNVTVKDVSDDEVLAYTLGFVSFNTFREFLDSFTGYDIGKLRDQKSASWVQTTYAAFSFEYYGTGIAFVRQVRLESSESNSEDDKIWEADMESVLSRLRQYEEDLSIKQLEKKRRQ